ncbi:MAG: SMC-Scp complex subunit ScpB [Kofleriaceae bacterium]
MAKKSKRKQAAASARSKAEAAEAEVGVDLADAGDEVLADEHELATQAEASDEEVSAASEASDEAPAADGEDALAADGEDALAADGGEALAADGGEALAADGEASDEALAADGEEALAADGESSDEELAADGAGSDEELAADGAGSDEELAADAPVTASALPDPELKSLLEALIFAADKPLTVQRIRQLTRVADVPRLQRLLAEITADHEHRGIVLQQVSGGYQFRTATAYSGWVQQLIAGRPVRLSRAQLETLAIIAYRQPITRPEIDEIRGVDSGGTLKVLHDRALIRALGKKEEPGRPILYGTTREFLDFFSLGDLRELPTLREYAELSPESRDTMARLGVSPEPPVHDPITETTTSTIDLAEAAAGALDASGDDVVYAGTDDDAPPERGEVVFAAADDIEAVTGARVADDEVVTGGAAADDEVVGAVAPEGIVGYDDAVSDDDFGDDDADRFE